MLREKLMAHQHEKDFRWRGGEIARIEGLSDAVFAFAVTLLVVSLEVPKTFTELMAVMRGFFAFAVCFGLLMQVWHEQYRYFRRYNLQDSLSTILNCVLLFLVLFYVYPLKFLFTFLVNGWLGFGTRVHLPGGGFENMIEMGQLPQLMAIFSGGYLAVCFIFVLLYGHALRRADALELNTAERFATRVSIGAAMLNGAVGLISLIIVAAAPAQFSGMAGMIYPILLGPGFTIYYNVMARKKRDLMEAAETGSRTAQAG
jgi:uncharacterized membrane protein